MESEAMNNLYFSNTPWSSMMRYASVLKKHPHKKSCNSKVQVFPMTFGKKLECVFSLYKWASQVVQWEKNICLLMQGTQETGVGSGRSPEEGNGNALPSIPVWKIPWTEATSRLQSMGLQKSWTQNVHIHTHTHSMNIHIHTNIYMQIDK